MVRAAPDSGSIVETRDALSRMVEELDHRGPDAVGMFADSAAGLGHARLSIIDVAGGSQPLTNEDGTIQVVCNGEIYNHRELRKELESRGHHLRSQSDCEVLAHLYEEVGEKLPERLNGMFALAVWDARRGRLFLARDRMGQKPLYYSLEEPDHAVVFGSELKVFTALSNSTRELDFESVAAYLAFGYIPDPGTIYKGVRKLPPGCFLSVTTTEATVQTYWRSVFDPTSVTADEAAEELEALFRDSVRLRMMADVPIGAFLSGGVDSSATAGAMAEQASGPIHTFAIGFDEPELDERSYSRLFAAQIGSHHREDLLTAPTPALMERFADVYDEPFGDSSALPTMRVSQLARESATVALSGDGADEVFGGYERYSRELLKGKLRSAVPGALLPALKRAAGETGAGLTTLTTAGRIRAGFGDVGGGAADSYFNAMAAFHDSDIEALLPFGAYGALGGRSPRETFRNRFIDTGSLPLLSQLQACDFETYLPGDILTKVDRASMAFSLEVRSPWLDHRIVEFAGRLPPSLKASGSARKKTVRRMLRGRVPESILHRPKRGFAIPAGRWLTSELGAVLVFAIAQPEIEELVRRDEVRRLLAASPAPAGRAATQLWHLFALAIWICRHRSRRAIDWEMIGRPAAA